MTLLLGVAASRGEAQGAPGVVTVHASRSTVTLSVPALRVGSTERARMAAYVSECRGAMELSAADSAAAVSLLPPELAAEALGADRTLLVSVTPRAGLSVDCGARGDVDGLFEERGLWIAFDSLVPPEQRIARVALRWAGEQHLPLALRQGTMRRLGPGGMAPLDARFLRLAYPLDAFAPQPTGRANALVLEVHYDSGSVPDVVTVPWPVLRELWDRVLASRAAAVPAQVPSLTLPTPRNAVLREAAGAFAAGESGSAAAVAATALWTEGLDAHDRRIARAQNALLFAEAGDSSAARVNLEYLVAENPCFSYAEAAPQSVRALLAQQERGSPRCSTRPLRQVAARAVVAPGFGRPTPTTGDRLRGAAVSGLVAGAIVAGYLWRSTARDQYATYLANDPDMIGPGKRYPSAAAAYEDAEATRVSSVAAFGVAAGVWLTQAVVSIWRERALERSLLESRAFGTPPARSAAAPVRLQPYRGTHGIGVEVTW